MSQTVHGFSLRNRERASDRSQIRALKL